jgi:ABC-type antimicrobial peptide transport system permease subunit
MAPFGAIGVLNVPIYNYAPVPDARGWSGNHLSQVILSTDAPNDITQGFNVYLSVVDTTIITEITGFQREGLSRWFNALSMRSTLLS